MEETNETSILNPFNKNNHLITEEDLQNIFKKLDLNISPNNMDFYILSFIHKSYTKSNNYEISKCKKNHEFILADKSEDCLDLFDKHNEKYEFLGDRVIDAVVVEYIFNRYNNTNADEGFMTKLKTRLVKTDTLAGFSQYLELDKYLIISNHMEQVCNGRVNKNILENTFEAFICAVFLDFNSIDICFNNINIKLGYEICKNIITYLLDNLIDFEDIVMNDDNYKDIILRYFQQNYHITPKYKILNEDGPPHKRTYRVGIYDQTNMLIGEGEGNSKKNAEQLASKQGLETLGHF
jgi:ribonuclease-3